jgi:hypothetical protein
MNDQPARLLDCGLCYEEQGEEVHPHPECPIAAPAVQAPAADRAGALLGAAETETRPAMNVPPIPAEDLIADAHVEPAADRAALRDRIAEALIAWTYRGKDPEHGGILETVRANAYSRADAVLAVLPAPTDRAAELVSVRPHTLTSIACHLDARAVAIMRPESQTYAEWQTVGAALRRMADEAQPAQPDTAPPAPATEPWRGATELATDREIAARAATGLVGYRQGRGALLHCLAHKPAPASRWADFHEVTADDLDDGGICVHPRCGRDLLAPWPVAGAQQDGPL